MRIKEEGPQLVIAEYHEMLFALGTVFLVVGGVFAYLYTQNSFRQDDWTGVALFLVVPAFLFFATTIYKTTADYSTQMLTIVRTSVIKKVTKHIPFSDISAIEIREQVRHSSKGGTRYYFPLYVILKNGTEELMIKPPARSVFIATPKPTREETVAKLLCQRIGIAYSFKKAPNVEDALDSAIAEITNRQQQKTQPPHS